MAVEQIYTGAFMPLRDPGAVGTPARFPVSFAQVLEDAAADHKTVPEEIAYRHEDPVLSPQEIKAAAQAHMLKRIAEVGLAQYTQEQKTRAKMLRVLNIVKAEGPPDEQNQIDGIIADFEHNPPDTTKEMFDRIHEWVKEIEPNRLDHLQERMQQVEKRIEQLMNESDAALEQRERADGLAAALPSRG